MVEVVKVGPQWGRFQHFQNKSFLRLYNSMTNVWFILFTFWRVNFSRGKVVHIKGFQQRSSVGSALICGSKGPQFESQRSQKFKI
jgi:hypothetical protein